MRRTSVIGLSEVIRTPTGLGGLVSNKKCVALTLVASLGGVLYCYSQVGSSHVNPLQIARLLNITVSGGVLVRSN